MMPFILPPLHLYATSGKKPNKKAQNVVFFGSLLLDRPTTFAHSASRPPKCGPNRTLGPDYSRPAPVTNAWAVAEFRALPSSWPDQPPAVVRATSSQRAIRCQRGPNTMFFTKIVLRTIRVFSGSWFDAREGGIPESTVRKSPDLTLPSIDRWIESG
jgi:hypothetical protein